MKHQSPQVIPHTVYHQHDDAYHRIAMVLRHLQAYYTLDSYLRNNTSKYSDYDINVVKLRYFTTFAKILDVRHDIPHDTVESIHNDFGKDIIERSLNAIIAYLIQHERYEYCSGIARLIEKLNVKNLQI